MHFCRSCPEHAVVYPRENGAYFECCLCGRKHTPEEVRGPFSVVTGGSGNVLQRGHPFDLQDHCLNPWCDSLTWAFVDDPAPGRTHRVCCECCGDWPEVPQTASHCFWCHETRTIKRTRGDKTRLECLSCRRERLHPDAPAPLDPETERRRIAFAERDATERYLDHREHVRAERPEYILRLNKHGEFVTEPTRGVLVTQADQDAILFADRVKLASDTRRRYDLLQEEMYMRSNFGWGLPAHCYHALPGKEG